MLARLERTQPVAGALVIALGEHVDYWNYIGWADPFSSAVYSRRQQEYARALGAEVYTPQMIVDGQAQFIGSHADRAAAAIAAAARAPKASIKIERVKVSSQTGAEQAGADVINFRVAATEIPAAPHSAVDLLLAITERGLHSNVARGENAGRRLRHATVVRQLNLIASAVAPASRALTAEHRVVLPGGWQRDKLTAVAWLQERASRRIVGAAALELAPQ